MELKNMKQEETKRVEVYYERIQKLAHGLQCHDPNLGLVTKARAWKGAGWTCNLGITFTFPRIRKSVRE